MKNELLKRIGLLSISTLAVISFVTQAKAAEENKVCQEVKYTNYYFFSEIYTETKLNEIINSGTERYHGTFFPALPENIIKESIEESKVCLTSDDNDMSCIKNEFDLDKFYTKYKAILTSTNNPTTVKFTIKDDNLTNKEGSSTYITEGKISYYLHGTWYATDETGKITGDSTKVVRYDSIENSELKTGAIIPDTTTIKPTIKEGEETIKFLITRKITAANKEGKTGFVLSSYSETDKTYLTPALYKITYKVEECTNKYNATINYLDKETKKEVHDPYKDSKLDDGYTKPVDSPEITGCTPDKETVEIKINGKDFEETVYYSCKTETIKDNPKTGSALIFTAWTVGIGALGYSAYYFSKMRKEKETGNDEE